MNLSPLEVLPLLFLHYIWFYLAFNFDLCIWLAHAFTKPWISCSALLAPCTILLLLFLYCLWIILFLLFCIACCSHIVRDSFLISCIKEALVRDAIHSHFVTLIGKWTIVGGWVKHWADKRDKVAQLKYKSFFPSLARADKKTWWVRKSGYG